MDSTQLERGTLESKDRDELTTIANALGGKPGSRARKAEIVDLILDLTGTGSNGSSPDSTGFDEEPPAEWEIEATTEEATVEEVTNEESEDASDGTEPQDDGKTDATTDQDDGEGGSDRAGNRSPGQDSGRQNQGRGQHQNRGQQGDPSDPGNRRRRRRGRERDSGPEEPWDGEPVEVSGHLDLRDEGYGFLRTSGFKPSKSDAYVSVKQVRQFSLRKGDQIVGASRPANRSEKNPALLRVDSVNGTDPEKAKGRPKFEDLTPLFPDEQLKMEIDDDPTNMTARIIDLLCPVGKGQRGMIVSPPKAGKTTIVKSIVRSIETNHPEVKLIVLLVDERPEEVTDMRRWMQRGEVVGSTFDRPSDEHTHLAEVTIERAKRMVEYGEDVVIVLDGITRLSRAYNEFKGTGNMELRLDRRISERRIYPAIDVNASSTRHEELLFERKQLNQVWKLRRVLNGLGNDGDAGAAAGLELLIDRLKTFNNNDEFLVEIAKGPSMGA